MGVPSNSKVFLSDHKDQKGSTEIHREEHCQSQTSIQEDHHHHAKQEEEKQRKTLVLKLEIPSGVGYEEEVVGDWNEGFKTPTSSDHRIPVITECPGAPRKRKSKCHCRRRIVLDLCRELESLIPMAYRVDLGDEGMSKRVKNMATW